MSEAGERRGGDHLTMPTWSTYQVLLVFQLWQSSGDVGVFHLGEIGWILLTPRLSKWHDTGLIHFVLTPVLSHLLPLALIVYFAIGRHGGLLVN
jgi:hypothetical protein